MVLLFLGNWRSDADHRADDPAVDPGLDPGRCSARRDAQPDDARRPRALGRHPGRPGDRDDREHRAPPAPGHSRSRRRSWSAPARSACRRFVSTLCICIVFVPMFFLSGVARFLFVPLAEAVVFAMIASYILSRTLVPTLVMLLMRDAHGDGSAERDAPSLLQRVYRAFDRAVRARARAPTRSRCRRCSRSAARFGVALPRLLRCCRAGSIPFLGRDFFPSVDAGQIRLHMRAPTGTRIEETARLADEVEAAIRQLIPPDQLETILDNLGVPNSGINLSYSNAGTIGTLDGEILLSLQGRPPADRGVRDAAARASCRSAFPASSSSSSRPTSSRRSSTSACRRRSTCSSPATTSPSNAALAAELAKTIRQIPGAVDAHVHQRLDAPAVEPADGPHAPAADGPVGVQRRPERAGRRSRAARRRRRRSGSTRRTASSTTSRCRRRSTSVDSLDALLNVPVARRRGSAARRRGSTQLLGNLVEATPGAPARRSSRATTSLPAIDVYVSVQGTDLASVAGAGAEAGRRGAAEAAARQPGRDARPGADDAVVVHRPRRRPGDGDRARLPADRRQLPVVDRRRDHHRRAAGRARRHRLDALHHRHDALACRRSPARS